jgi:hypothetical protein
MKKWKPLSQKRADNRLLKELKRERNKANTEAAKKKEQRNEHEHHDHRKS